MNYFLVMLSDWRFSARDFKHRLLTRWPHATLHEAADPGSLDCFEFELPMAHSKLVGALRRDGSGIAFDGDLRDVAEFALWCRSFVPEAERLHFCDEGVSGQLDLTPHTSPADLFRLFDYTPPPPGWRNYSLISRPQWDLPPHEFAQHLCLRWPSAHVQLEPDTHRHRTVSFQVPMVHSSVTGALCRPVPSLDFTGDARDCAALALWCRSVLLAEQVSVSSEGRFLVLHSTTTVEDFLRALGAPPS
ncbi:hypothetical protein F0U61_52205 [Archangium violaceum]|uniref:hypothetical protein n=1 Tax=Archangium violaceum TaxID=83451 RepID=UPI002B322CF3|nr:hypothetical protein F0U61_52205 [Archangium violaceum]